jgi:hypothetical protein
VTEAGAVEIRKLAHGGLLKIEENYEKLRFNTAIAEVRKLANGINNIIGAMEAAPSDEEALALREAADFLVVPREWQHDFSGVLADNGCGPSSGGHDHNTNTDKR